MRKIFNFNITTGMILIGSIALVAVIGCLLNGCQTEDDPKKENTLTVVTLSQTAITLEVDEEVPLSVTTDPANAKITWTSSDTAVATVDSAGWVYGVYPGSAVITATAEDDAFATCDVTVVRPEGTYVIKEGPTLAHYLPALKGVPHFGTNLGTDNADGSYTFDGTAGNYSGGGAQYNFPLSTGNATWEIEDYQIVELHFKVTEGSVTAMIKKSGNNVDLKPYPTDATNNIAFNTTTNGGKFTYKTVIGEAGSGIGLQRNNGGPATIAIEKVVFSKIAMRTITFTGGDYTDMEDIEPISIPTGRTVNFGSNYTMPEKPRRPGYTFTDWYTTAGAVFNQSAAITADVVLAAHWEAGEPEAVDMKLNLDPSTWGTLPPVHSGITGGSGWSIPSTYATSDYTNNVLTFTFSGDNRQRAIIPLSAVQIAELILPSVTGVTFRIVGTVKTEEGADSSAEFRCHLISAGAGSNWNGTNTGLQTALKDHLVEYVEFSGNKSAATLGWFCIQAMYRDASGDGTQSGFPKVILTIESITIDIGDTR